jgi:hypothetical protein
MLRRRFAPVDAAPAAVLPSNRWGLPRAYFICMDANNVRESIMLRYLRFALIPLAAAALYIPLGLAQEKAQDTASSGSHEACVNQCGARYDACVKTVRKHSTSANYKVLHPAPAGESGELDRFALIGCQSQQEHCERLCGGGD